MQRARHTLKLNPRLDSNTSKIQLLNSVKRIIVANPRILDMNDFYSVDAGWKRYCIASLVLIAAGTKVERVLDPHEQARKLLGLSETAAERLFVASGHYKFDPQTIADYRHNARLAARRLDLAMCG
jgi:hypothetical protein